MQRQTETMVSLDTDIQEIEVNTVTIDDRAKAINDLHEELMAVHKKRDDANKEIWYLRCQVEEYEMVALEIRAKIGAIISMGPLL